jgi:hypothetical protein
LKLRRPHIFRLFPAALLACALVIVAHAQSPKVGDSTQARPQPNTKQTSPSKQATTKKTNADAARKAREVRDATAALREVADAARSFDNLLDGIAVQSEAADALWPYDEQGARAILHRAWEAATAPGAEDKLKGFENSEDARGDALEALMDARRFIIKSATKHDPRLGDTFMKEFERYLADLSSGAQNKHDSGQSGEQSDSDSPQRGGRHLSPAGFQRFVVAEELLVAGDYKQAAEMIAPVIAEGPNTSILPFILDLRANDASDADALYLRLLEVTRADPSADSNDVLLLSTPIVSPGMVISMSQDGSANIQVIYYNDDHAMSAAASLPKEARLAFFDVAASVLLRPGATGGDGQADASAPSDYFAIGRLLPFVEREAPQLAPALHARQAALAQELDASRRDALASKMDVSSLSSTNPSDPLAFNLDKIARSKSPAERDLNRLTAVDAATGQGLWDRARHFAEEIEDASARRDARFIIAVRQVLNISRSFDGDGQDDAVRAADLAHAADVPPGVRAIGLAQAAELAARRGAHARADQLIEEAASYAAQADRGEHRVTALAFVTLSATRADAGRVWELLQALTHAGDENDELPFGNLFLRFFVGPDDNKYDFLALVPPVRLSDVFAAAARLDLTRALAAARSLKGSAPRAHAMLAAARAALEKSSGVRDAGAR